MSAPKTRDPLVVNTQDGSCWLRRAVTRDGRGLYALEGTPRCCPEYVLASLRELAEIGLRGMADALPMPVGTEDSSARRDRYAAAVLKVKSLAGLFADVRAHVDPVMAVADAELETLRARVAELEAAAGDGSTRTVDEDPIAFALTPQAEALHASSGRVVEVPEDVSPQVADLRALLARQREDAHDSELYHTYAIGRDLPEVQA